MKSNRYKFKNSKYIRRLLFGSLLCAMGLFLLYTPLALAECDLKSGSRQYNYANPGWSDRYGAFTEAKAYYTPSICEHQLTQMPGTTVSEKTTQAGTASVNEVWLDIPVKATFDGSASISNFNIVASAYEYNSTNVSGTGWGSVVDLVLLENPSGSASDTTTIPVTYCSELTSPYSTIGTNKTYLKYKDYNYGGENAYYDSMDIGGSIVHTANGEVCQSGNITMKGKSVYFSIGLDGYTIGNAGVEVFTKPDNTDVNVAVLDGTITAEFEWTKPAGYTCYSASGIFPGCERTLHANKMGLPDVNAVKESVYAGSSGGLTSSTSSNGSVTNNGGSSGSTGSSPDSFNSISALANSTGACSKLTGNPINFALGFKQQTQSDYASNSLAFTRIYRSDSTWTSDSLGKLWRHNYDRSLNVITTPESATADITDSSGAMILFRQDTTTNDWYAVDQDINSSLVSIYDSVPTLTGYLYTTEDDRREYYDTSGKLIRIEARGLQSVDLSYDVSDRLQTVTDEGGSTITLTYDGSNRVATMASPSGTFTYAYDGNGNLSTVTKPDTKVRTYHYEDTSFVNALTGITNEKNIRIATYAYDSTGRATSSEHIGGVNNATVAYNSDDTTTVTNALGKDTIYTFETIQGVRKIVSVAGQASTNCAAANKSYAYDEFGYLTSKTDWKGNTTTYVNDARGLPTSMTQDAGGTAERTITTTYDAVFHLRDIVTDNGKTTDYDYDSDGRVTTITVTDTATSETRITTYTYKADTTDSNGNPLLGRIASINGPRTDVTDTTSYDYDSNFRLTKVTNAAGHISETLTFDSADRPLTLKDANGIITTLTYDALGRLKTNTKDAATTTYDYDDNGSITKITQPNGAYTLYYYNDNGRLRLVRDADNGNWFFYDNAGNITLETKKKIMYGDNTYVHYQTFDELSRKLTDRDHPGNETTYAYDDNSNLTSTLDPNSNATTYAFDGLNRLTSQTDTLSGVTTNAINDLDQTTSVTDPRSNATTYVYNAFGDITSMTSPDTGTTTYTHDKAGNIKSQTDASSVVTNYTYDELNRLLTTSYPADTSLNVTLTYDSVTGCGDSKGKLCSVTDASGTRDYIYDAKGLLTSVTDTRASLVFTTSYSYDASGILTGITLPSGRDITYTLDGNALVSSVSADINTVSTTLASAASYLAYGPMDSLIYGNGVTLTNVFANNHRLTSRTIGTMLNDSYTYDNAGNITVKGADTYTLDALYRITGENSDTYTYDAIANRLSMNATSYVYPSTSSILSSVGSDSYTHNAVGSNTDDSTRSYTYDKAGRVATVTISSTTVGTYTYDANNQRTKKVAGSTTTHYVYGAGGLLYGEYDASGDLLVEYVYLNGEPLAQIDDVSSSDVLTYLHTDHLGTPRYASNTSGTQVWSWLSDAFGNGAPSGTATVNLRFAGQYFDAESDLHYNWNRYYDPATGRYITSDPIGLAGGLNTYGYVGANPVLFIDPEGLIGGKLCKLVPFCKKWIEKPIKDATKKAMGWCEKVGKRILPNSRATKEVNPKNLIPTESPRPSGIKDYVKDIKNGKDLEPIHVAKINGRYYIVNGHHRAAAARKLGKAIRIIVVRVSKAEADDLIRGAAEVAMKGL